MNVAPNQKFNKFQVMKQDLKINKNLIKMNEKFIPWTKNEIMNEKNKYIFNLFIKHKQKIQSLYFF